MSNCVRLLVAILFLVLTMSIVVTAQEFTAVLTPQNGAWYDAKRTWALKRLTGKETLNITNSIDVQRLKNNILPHLLIVRPPGSVGSAYVRETITKILRNFLGWTVEHNSFTASPPHPYPPTTFTNIIATRNPSAKRRLVLACHYDSKLTPVGFVGATDSAVPCSIMIEIAIALADLLSKPKNKNDLTLQLIFFDGEEAFVKWTGEDSLYGSRYLAQMWQATGWPPNDLTSTKTKLDSIDLLTVLDLLGSSNPKFYNNDLVTSKHFEDLIRIEKSLYGRNSYFQRGMTQTYVADDHLPFYVRRVDVLHVIAEPFPIQWHTLNDNSKNLDFATIGQLTNIFAVFVCEYLHLEIFN